jgi:hypothetical protein
MSYVLLVVACLNGHPDECREHRLPLPQITNATACHLGGAVLLRDWIADHRGWRLTDVKCLASSKVASAQN